MIESRYRYIPAQPPASPLLPHTFLPAASGTPSGPCASSIPSNTPRIPGYQPRAEPPPEPPPGRCLSLPPAPHVSALSQEAPSLPPYLTLNFCLPGSPHPDAIQRAAALRSGFSANQKPGWEGLQTKVGAGRGLCQQKRTFCGLGTNTRSRRPTEAPISAGLVCRARAHVGAGAGGSDSGSSHKSTWGSGGISASSIYSIYPAPRAGSAAPRCPPLFTASSGMCTQTAADECWQILSPSAKGTAAPILGDSPKTP